MSEPTTSPIVQSPPPAAQPAVEDLQSSARSRLLQLARELAQTRNRRLMAEFLQLRRAMR